MLLYGALQPFIGSWGAQALQGKGVSLGANYGWVAPSRSLIPSGP
jgi:hypothetical protein